MGALTSAIGQIPQPSASGQQAPSATGLIQQAAMPGYQPSTYQPPQGGPTTPGRPGSMPMGNQASMNMRLNASMPSMISALRMMSNQRQAQPMQFRTLGNAARPAYTAPTMNRMSSAPQQMRMPPQTYKGAPLPQANSFQRPQAAPSRAAVAPPPRAPAQPEAYYNPSAMFTE